MAVVDAAVTGKAIEALRALSRRAHVHAAYLFSSRIEGTADEWSDIDLTVFIDEAESWDLDQRVAACVETQRLVGDDIELHLFSSESLGNPPRASFAQYVLKHGVPLEIDDLSSASPG